MNTIFRSGLVLPLAALVACGPEEPTEVPESLQILLGETLFVENGHSIIAAFGHTPKGLVWVDWRDGHVWQVTLSTPGGCHMSAYARELHGEPDGVRMGSLDGDLGGPAANRSGLLRLRIDGPRAPCGAERVKDVRVGFPAPRCEEGDQWTKTVEHLWMDRVLSPFPLTSICSRLRNGSLDEGIELDALGRPTEIWWQRAGRVRSSTGVWFMSKGTKLALWEQYGHTFDDPPDLWETARSGVMHFEWYPETYNVARYWTELDGFVEGPSATFDSGGELVSIGGWASGEKHGMWLYDLRPGASHWRAELWERGKLVATPPVVEERE